MRFYKGARACLGFIFRIIFRLRLRNAEKIPSEGAVVLCFNHLSILDAIVAGVAIKRPIVFLGKDELFHVPLLKHAIRALNVIPVDRANPSTDTYKMALAALANARPLGIFIQGTRVRPEETRGAKAGAVMFAHKGGANIVPIGIKATYRPFSKVIINVGDTIDMTEYHGKRLPKEQMTAISDSVMDTINELARVAE